MVGAQKGAESHRRIILVIIVCLLLAFAARVLSHQWSPLPYNIDGLTEIRIGKSILLSGHLDFEDVSSLSDSYASDLPLSGLLAAFSVSLLGSDITTDYQMLAAILGAFCIGFAFVVYRTIFRSSYGALTTALVLALIGSFVFAAGCSWKETLGISLVLLSTYAFLHRRQARFRGILIISLAMLVFVHHHSALVGLVILTFWALIQNVARMRGSQTGTVTAETGDFPILGMAWMILIVYYVMIGLPYLDYLSPGTDLYLYLAVAGVLLLLGVKSARSGKRFTSLPIGLVIPILGTFLMVINYYEPIFPGIPAPSALIFVPFIAYLILVVPALEGARIAFSLVTWGRPMLLSMILAPLSLITFAFLRAQDATSHMIIFRTFDFLMIGFAILVGLGFAHLFRGRPRAGVAGGICLVIICASTLPIAYNSQKLFGVQNHTFDFEYDAVEWFSENGVDSYTSDQRLGETGWRLFDIDYSRGLPYDLTEGLTLNESSFFVLEGQWSTNGAQEFPFGVVVVDEEIISVMLWSNSVIYIGGPTDNPLVLFKTLD